MTVKHKEPLVSVRYFLSCPHCRETLTKKEDCRTDMLICSACLYRYPAKEAVSMIDYIHQKVEKTILKKTIKKWRRKQ